MRAEAKSENAGALLGVRHRHQRLCWEYNRQKGQNNTREILEMNAKLMTKRPEWTLQKQVTFVQWNWFCQEYKLEPFTVVIRVGMQCIAMQLD